MAENDFRWVYDGEQEILSTKKIVGNQFKIFILLFKKKVDDQSLTNCMLLECY